MYAPKIDETLNHDQTPSSPPPSVPQSGTSDPLPGRTPAPPTEKLPGFPELTDEDRTTLENIPVIPDDARHEIGDAIAGAIVERTYGDREDKRGSDAIFKCKNILARECKAAIDASRLADMVEHIGGASRDGEDKNMSMSGRSTRRTATVVRIIQWDRRTTKNFGIRPATSIPLRRRSTVH
jgi:hypothetical protein